MNNSTSFLDFWSFSTTRYHYRTFWTKVELSIWTIGEYAPSYQRWEGAVKNCIIIIIEIIIIKNINNNIIIKYNIIVYIIIKIINNNNKYNNKLIIIIIIMGNNTLYSYIV